MDGDSEEQEQEQDDLLNELKAEVEALREEVSEINEPTRLVYSEAERKTTTHFMDDLTGDEDDAGVQSKFIEFVRERYAGTTAAMTLPDNTDLIIAKYGTCLKICYLTRIDGFTQPAVPLGLATLVREELVGGSGTSAPKMAFIFWDTCGCDCDSDSGDGDCPEENSTYTVEWETWQTPSYGSWNSCREQFLSTGSTYYRPVKKGRTVFTRGSGGGYSVVNAADHQEGLYTLSNCTGHTEPTLVDTTPHAVAQISYDTGHSPPRWQLQVDSGFFYPPDCSPIGSFENSDGAWFYKATVT